MKTDSIENLARLEVLAIDLFKDRVTFLDAALTRKRFDAIMQNWKNTPDKLKHPLKWAEMSEPYYLSDGGYSRIFAKWDGENFDSVKLYLDSVSTESVKSAWGACKELIADVEESIKIAIRIELEI